MAASRDPSRRRGIRRRVEARAHRGSLRTSPRWRRKRDSSMHSNSISVFSAAVRRFQVATGSSAPATGVRETERLPSPLERIATSPTLGQTTLSGLPVFGVIPPRSPPHEPLKAPRNRAHASFPKGMRNSTTWRLGVVSLASAGGAPRKETIRGRALISLVPVPSPAKMDVSSPGVGSSTKRAVLEDWSKDEKTIPMTIGTRRIPSAHRSRRVGIDSSLRITRPG